jgi:hypothetical protein
LAFFTCHSLRPFFMPEALLGFTFQSFLHALKLQILSDCSAPLPLTKKSQAFPRRETPKINSPRFEAFFLKTNSILTKFIKLY